MKVARVSELIGTNTRQIQSQPKEGTKLREVFDAFHRGDLVRTGDFREVKMSNLIAQLRDFYGLEIERVGFGVYRLS